MYCHSTATPSRAQLQVGRAVVLGINCAEAIAIKAVLRHQLWYEFRHSHVHILKHVDLCQRGPIIRHTTLV
eukprot:scaffold22655_cov17-Prasinocladus_malaysianus.AAC.1